MHAAEKRLPAVSKRLVGVEHPGQQVVGARRWKKLLRVVLQLLAFARQADQDHKRFKRVQIADAEYLLAIWIRVIEASVSARKPIEEENFPDLQPGILKVMMEDRQRRRLGAEQRPE